MTTLPTDFDALYAALLARDDAFDGRVYVGVTSTGIFCRLTCPARKPRPENCRFLPSVEACLDAGFRACRRCRPTGPEALADPVVAPLMAALAADPTAVWRERDLVERGYDPSTVRRAFRRQYGRTFLQVAREQRVLHGIQGLQDGLRVADAQVDAGYASAAAFRDSVASLLGRPPAALVGDGPLRADRVRTPLGSMLAVADDDHLHLLEFVDRRALPTELTRLERVTGHRVALGTTAVHRRTTRWLADFFAARSPREELPLALHGTEFQREVWAALRLVPAGETTSYGALAASLGRPGASRAVAAANGANQLALVVPCHRVVGADGSLTGYGGGLWRKQALIEIEARHATRGTRRHDARGATAARPTRTTR